MVEHERISYGHRWNGVYVGCLFFPLTTSTTSTTTLDIKESPTGPYSSVIIKHLEDHFSF
jgi:hypothetical protein